MTNPYPILPGEAIAALEKGNKIEAIKFVRTAFNVDLKEAKDIVEGYIKSNPSIKERISADDKLNPQSTIKWIFLLGAIILLVYYIISNSN